MQYGGGDETAIRQSLESGNPQSLSWLQTVGAKIAEKNPQLAQKAQAFVAQMRGQRPF